MPYQGGNMKTPHSASHLSRRKLLTLLGSGAGLTLLAACAPIAPSAPTAPPAPTQPAAKPAAPSAPAAPVAVAPAAAPAASPAPAAAAAQASPTAVAERPRAGGSLRVGRTSDIARIDGHSTTATDVVWQLYDKLISYDESYTPQGLLAESWEVSSDGKQVKLNLRKGVTFHSGREFTSDDVKWNLLRVRDPKAGAGALVNQSNWFTTIDTPDKNTVVLKSDQPRALIFDFFENFNILDRVSVESPDGANKGIGTGPLSLGEWLPGERITLVKNKNYWQSGKPYLDQVSITVFKDFQAMVTQLEAGVLDLITELPNRDFVRLKADPKYRAVSMSNGLFLLGANVTVPPLENKKVRQAFNYLIDRKRIVETILLNTVKAQAIPAIPGSIAYDAAKDSAYGFDLDKAKALLAEAGVANLDLDIIGSVQTAEHAQMAQVIQADAAKIGVKLNVKIIEHAQFLDQTANRKYRGLYLGNLAYANLEPATMIDNSRHLDPTGTSNTGFTSERYLSLVRSAAGEPDLAKRKQLYAQLVDLFLDESAIMTIAANEKSLVARASVRGITTAKDGVFHYTDMWLAS
jgi:peptide/nickel transport system substrate-binding protein